MKGMRNTVFSRIVYLAFPHLNFSVLQSVVRIIIVTNVPYQKILIPSMKCRKISKSCLNIGQILDFRVCLADCQFCQKN
jgi:hypothetical protein